VFVWLSEECSKNKQQKLTEELDRQFLCWICKGSSTILTSSIASQQSIFVHWFLTLQGFPMILAAIDATMLEYRSRRFRLVNSHIAGLTADTTRTIKLGLNNSINSPLFGMNRHELWCCWIRFNQSSPWPIVISSNLQ
jgi:hypothetical protein